MMNLTNDPWIPVVWENGKADKVSLLDAFQKGDQIRDLAVRPHERIALMRLLICIAQAALDGPKDRADWLSCRARLPQTAANYLAKWKHSFELFGDGQRFLQTANVKPAKDGGALDGSLPSKLDLTLATGNNTTLFDNAGGSDRVFSSDTIALLLLSFQNFSPGGLISDVKWHDITMGRNSNHSPCIVKAMLHTYLKRFSLVDTVHANILARDHIKMLGYQWGKPIWEKMPDGPEDSEAIANASCSYLGRLIPMSRAVRLSPDGRSLVMGAAIIYDPEWREVAATVVVRHHNDKSERTFLNASLAKSVWREAHSIAVLATAANQMPGGPLALASLDENKGTDVWCGALVANKAKLLDAVESVFHIPGSMFTNEGRRLYQQGVEQAEYWGRKINRAVSTCHRELHDELDKAELHKRGNLVKQKASSHYWTAIEQKVPLLLALVKDPAPLFPGEATKENWSGTQWGKALARAAREAYELACPHTTPRQLKAYALGLNALFKPVETEAEKPTEETEE
ncbi:MAG: type I-E CRISPR-associated protein Cse1/CasA [Kiritimatiellaeota bacterium]|nr:type I-E CRISPR-associated protein Cse1/CasA [Kiritimatiellota bacterium]